MKVSLKWLSEYIDLSDISVDEAAEIITKAGLEVDEIIDNRKVFQNFVVGYVKEKKKHPNADKLSLCVVNDGNEDFNVVCGAPNVDAGQKSPSQKLEQLFRTVNLKLKKLKFVVKFLWV